MQSKRSAASDSVRPTSRSTDFRGDLRATSNQVGAGRWTRDLIAINRSARGLGTALLAPAYAAACVPLRENFLQPAV